MKLYVGQTRDPELVQRLQDLGVGECTNRGELPPRRLPYFLDNGAFSDWKNEKPFDLNRWLRDLRYISYRLEDEWPEEMAPDFTVIPDQVAAGLSSLRFSLEHLDWAEDILHVPHYLAVQDGMTTDQVGAVIHNFGGIFVGGSLEWKLDTMGTWADLAHAHQLPCHAGRIGTIPRIQMAKQAGVDSVDSCQPLWVKERLEKFVAEALSDRSDIPLGL